MLPRPEAPSLTHRRERIAWTCLLLCLCFLLLDRGLILHQFGFRYVDDDQAIMWNGAMEMAQGHFHEPCFYGQRYNTMLEGLVAVPLLWSGIRPDVALPLATSLLTLFPFVFLAALLVRQSAYFAAAIVLVLPVTLPPEYGMITSMPRGFITGVFLSSFVVLPLFWNHRFAFFLSSLFAVLAVFANPNAALVVAPAGLLILLQNYADRRLYLWGLAGAIPAGIVVLAAGHFYDLHPTYVIHTQWELVFNLQDISLSGLRYLNELSPILWGKGGFILILLAAVLFALGVARQWKSAIALFAGIVLLVLSFGFSKVHDGIPSVFYPWARMFLGIPFLLALFASRLKWRSPVWVLLLMPLLSAGFFGYKCAVQDAAVERQVAQHRETNVEVEEVRELERHCLRINAVAQANHSRLFVIGWSDRKHLTNYGCPCLFPDFPATMEPYMDRRTWWLKTVASQVATNVLFSGLPESHFRELPPPFNMAERVSQDPELFLLKGNVERTDSMLVHVRIGMREH